MAKSKPNRSLKKVGEAQVTTEKGTRDKFTETESVAKGKQDRTPSISLPSGRVSPQLSCTVLPEDKQLLNEITIYAINKAGKLLNTSSIIRSIIRLASRRKDELEF